MMPRPCLSTQVAHRIAIACVAVFITGMPSIAHAAGVVGTGTAASCTDAALDAALAGGGLVTFDCGGPATIKVTPKLITEDTTIDGGGLITISGGNAIDSGGAIDNESTLTVSNITFADNHAGECILCFASGGAILNSGTLTVTNSMFSGNDAEGSGDAIYNYGGKLTVTNSSFSGNGNGDLYNAIVAMSPPERGGMLTVTNSTFSGDGMYVDDVDTVVTITNSTFSDGGILVHFGELIVTNSTFLGNVIGLQVTACGVGSDPPCPLVRNTIVASGCFLGDGTSIDGGHNLDSGESCGLSAANGSLTNTAPRLDPAGLRDNGGPTQTVALCTAVGVPPRCSGASRAIDAGDPVVCAAAPVHNLDQRGAVRPGTGHAHCSIGAYEAEAGQNVCDGDCDGDGAVLIDELIVGVNIALELQPGTACPAFLSAQGTVDIARLITGVINALNGCGGP